MDKFIDYIVFIVLSSVLILFFYPPFEFQETLWLIKSAGIKFYFLLTVIGVHLYFLLIFVEWVGFKIIDRLINNDR